MTISETYKAAVARLTPLYGEREAAVVVSRLLDEKYRIRRLKQIVHRVRRFR